MQAELESIRVGYETLGLSIEDIASDRGLEVASVKSALLNCSSKYRRDVGVLDSSNDESKKLDFSDNDLLAVNNVIREVALYGEDDNIRLKAAMYIRDDKKGRRELRQVLGGNTFNILAFNHNMAQMREKVEKMKQQMLEVKEV